MGLAEPPEDLGFQGACVCFLGKPAARRATLPEAALAAEIP